VDAQIMFPNACITTKNSLNEITLIPDNTLSLKLVLKID
jgi:hypothetical protein